MKLETILSGGNPRSLGRTEEVVELVLANITKFDELFQLLFSTDEIIRMRASDALEKICRQHPEWLELYKEVLLGDIPMIRQASVQWHLAQILSEINLTVAETQLATTILKNNLESTNDWIVENLSLESLASFTRRGSFDADEFISILNLHSNSRHKSVVSRVNKLLEEFRKAFS